MLPREGELRTAVGQFTFFTHELIASFVTRSGGYLLCLRSSVAFRVYLGGFSSLSAFPFVSSGGYRRFLRLKPTGYLR
jgi:hypothetical protein